MNNTKVDYTKSQNGTEILGFDKKPFKRMSDPFLTYEQNKIMNQMFYTGYNHATSPIKNHKTINCDISAEKIVWYSQNGVSLSQELVEFYHNVHNPQNAKANRGSKNIQTCGAKGSLVRFSNSNPNCRVCVSYIINIHNFINPNINI